MADPLRPHPARQATAVFGHVEGRQAAHGVSRKRATAPAAPASRRHERAGRGSQDRPGREGFRWAGRHCVIVILGVPLPWDIGTVDGKLRPAVGTACEPARRPSGAGAGASA